eukprot:212056_1
MEEDQDAEEGDTYDDNKAIEMEREEAKHDTIDFHSLCEIMRKHKVHDIGIHELRSAFGAYADGNKKDALIADTIDAYYCSNDELLPSSNAISIASLCGDCTRRRAIYEIILFHYFEKQDINNANFIKIAEKLLATHYPDIDVALFHAIATTANINGKMFIQGTPEYKNSLKFAKIFKSIKDKKKDFTNLYGKIKSNWDRMELAMEKAEMNDDDAKIEIQHDESKHNRNPPTDQSEPQDVYEIGTQFYYWDSHRHHKRYIRAKYSHLKDETLNNAVRRFDVSQWKLLQTQCQTDNDSDAARNIKSNGFWKKTYQIAQSTLLSMHHLAALKIYTDHTTGSKLYCAALRSANPQR